MNVVHTCANIMLSVVVVSLSRVPVLLGFRTFVRTNARMRLVTQKALAAHDTRALTGLYNMHVGRLCV